MVDEEGKTPLYHLLKNAKFNFPGFKSQVEIILDHQPNIEMTFFEPEFGYELTYFHLVVLINSHECWDLFCQKYCDEIESYRKILRYYYFSYSR